MVIGYSFEEGGGMSVNSYKFCSQLVRSGTCLLTFTLMEGRQNNPKSQGRARDKKLSLAPQRLTRGCTVIMVGCRRGAREWPFWMIL